MENQTLFSQTQQTNSQTKVKLSSYWSMARTKLQLRLYTSQGHFKKTALVSTGLTGINVILFTPQKHPNFYIQDLHSLKDSVFRASNLVFIDFFSRFSLNI